MKTNQEKGWRHFQEEKKGEDQAIQGRGLMNYQEIGGSEDQEEKEDQEK